MVCNLVGKPLAPTGGDSQAWVRLVRSHNEVVLRSLPCEAGEGQGGGKLPPLSGTNRLWWCSVPTDDRLLI